MLFDLAFPIYILYIYFDGSKGQTSLKIKIKKLCLTLRFETDNITSVELLLRHNE